MTNPRVHLWIRAALASVLAATCVQLHAAAAPSFLWKATSPKGGTIYLAGSVHLLTADYYPLSSAFDKAFQSTDLLVEELDMGELLSPASQLEMLRRGMLPAGRTLDDVVQTETLKAVVDTLNELGMPLAPLKQFKPWMLALTLQGLSWQKAGFDANLGLDKHFYDLAKADSRPVQGLETLDYQISQFDNMSASLQDRLLAETLAEMKATDKSFVRIADAWKTGDTAILESVVLKDLKTEADIYQRLVVERNHIWLPKIEELFARPAPAFVIVGAAHLVGQDGLLQLLRAKGYRIEQL